MTTGILVSFTNIENVIFSGWYIPPRDSPYYDSDMFAKFSVMATDDRYLSVIFGDFNAKMKNNDCLLHENSTYKYNYQAMQNGHGDLLQSICKSKNLLILNGLSTGHISYNDSLTYRKAKEWISMLDLCIISSQLLPNVRLFTVNQNLTLPSDHAIVSLSFSNQNLSDCKNVLKRAIDLSEYNIPQKKVIKRSICYETLNKKDVIEQLKQIIPPPVNDVNICIKWINDKMYEIAANSIKQDTD